MDPEKRNPGPLEIAFDKGYLKRHSISGRHAGPDPASIDQTFLKTDTGSGTV
jgi:hypothetical protein